MSAPKFDLEKITRERLEREPARPPANAAGHDSKHRRRKREYMAPNPGPREAFRRNLPLLVLDRLEQTHVVRTLDEYEQITRSNRTTIQKGI